MEALREERLDDFMDFDEEAPTLECIPSGCKMCLASMRCAPKAPREPLPLPPPEVDWDGDTEPSVVPGFMRGFDDDFILDSELGGEE